jgi:hypothetical protein
MTRLFDEYAEPSDYAMARKNDYELAHTLYDLLATVRGGNRLVNTADGFFAVADALNYRGKELALAVESLAMAMNRIAAALEKRS